MSLPKDPAKKNEYLMKLRNAKLGRTLSVETRTKMSLAQKRVGNTPPSSKGKVFSVEHRRKISEAHKARVALGTHHSWKGGVSTANELQRKSIEYKLWREAVFKRDNYTCQENSCGAHSGNGKRVELHADHIKPFAYFPELRFAIDNGRTLCVPCHKKTKTYGFKSVLQYGDLIKKD